MMLLKKLFIIFLLIIVGLFAGILIIVFPRINPPPQQVENLQITVLFTGNSLNLSWNHNDDYDLSHYNIYRSTSPNVSLELVNLIASPISNDYLDTNLVDGQYYYYQVTAVDDASNEGTPSNETMGQPQDSVAPQKVTGVEIIVIPTGNSLNITWTPNTDFDLVEYGLYRSTTHGFTPDAFNPDVRVTTNYYLDTNLTSGITYYYRIDAIDEVPNYGPYSNEANGTPI